MRACPGRAGTVFLQLECVSPDRRIEGPRCPGLIRYVLGSRPDLEDALLSATRRVYPDGPPGYPDCSPLRIVWSWVAFPDSHPEVWRAVTRVLIRARLRELQECLDRAYEAREWEGECFPEAPETVWAWRRRRYRVVTFSPHRTMEAHRAVIDGAIPDAGIVMAAVPPRPSSSELRRDLLAQIPEEPPRTLVVVDARDYALTSEWREREVRTVVVDRGWTPEPHLLPGRSLYVPSLSEIDPTLELQREYF